MTGRDLNVRITGDPSDLDAALDQVTREAKKLDRELSKVERTQKAQERQARASAAAIRAYGAESGKSAQQARQLGMAAQKAAEQAERAQIRAAAAAEDAAKGRGSQERAARLAADAEDRVARAALKAAEAHRAAARAADEQADQERQVARQATLAAAAQRLGQLKAAGAVKEHNALLGHLTSRFGDLSKEAAGAFTAMTGTGAKAFGALSSAATSFASTGIGAIIMVVAVLASIPFAALGAAGAVTLGLGGALAGLGLMAVKGDAQVKSALTSTAEYAKTTATQIAAPFKRTWLDIASVARQTIAKIAPELQKDFASLAPVISRFAQSAGASVVRLVPAFHAVSQAAGRILDQIGPKLPAVVGNIGRAIEIMARAAGSNSAAFGNLIVNVSRVLPLVAHLVDIAIKLGSVFNLTFSALTGGLGKLRTFGSIIGSIGGPLVGLVAKLLGIRMGSDHAKGGVQRLGSEAGRTSNTLRGTSASSAALAKDMKTLSSSTASAEQKATALTNAFKRLLDPQQGVFDDTTRLKQGMGELAKALKKSHGSMSDMKPAGQAARQAFSGVLTTAKSLANNLLASGASIDTVRRKMQPYIASMYKAAGSNREARRLVDGFVRSLGLVPPKKGTKVSVPGATGSKHSVDKLTDSVKRIPGKKDSKISAPGARKSKGEADDVHGAVVAIPRGKTTVIKINGKHIVISAIREVIGWLARLVAAPATITVRIIKKLFGSGGGLVPGFAQGGPVLHYAGAGITRVRGYPTGGSVTGPGTGTSDSIPAMLSNGEYVINAAATRIYRPLLDAINYGVSVPAARGVPVRGGDGASARPISQTINVQSADPHVIAREAARELAWTMR